MLFCSSEVASSVFCSVESSLLPNREPKKSLIDWAKEAKKPFASSFVSSLSTLSLILSAVLAVCRVVGGVHYPRDVVVGYALGLVCGALLFLF